ncbi:FHA domain-containing protein, partial [Streptomyces boluensis]
MADRPLAPTAPEVVLETETGSTVMSPGHEYHVGRDPLSDIVIDDARVSWHHAVLRTEDGHWTLEDEHSTNGTFTDGTRVHTRDVGPGSEIRFGNVAGPRATLLGPPE